MKLSARNQIPARVTSIHAGEAIANVELDVGGVRLVASITVKPSASSAWPRAARDHYDGCLAKRARVRLD
jgi:hypothetical protein